MNQSGDSDRFPERTGKDQAADVLRGALSSLVPGGFAAVPFLETEHERRMADFHRRTAERLRTLETHSTAGMLARADEGDQAAKDQILSTYFVIVRLVQEAMDEEKRDTLAAAMTSTLLWSGEEAERRDFLRCLSDFEGTHVALLARARVGLYAVREFADAMSSSTDLLKTAWKELYDRGMVSSDSYGGMMTPSGLRSPRTTERGVRFLDFVGQGARDEGAG